MNQTRINNSLITLKLSIIYSRPKYCVSYFNYRFGVMKAKLDKTQPNFDYNKTKIKKNQHIFSKSVRNERLREVLPGFTDISRNI